MARFLLITLTGLVLIAGCSRMPDSETATSDASVDAAAVAAERQC